MDYPYILKTGTIKNFMDKIPSIGVPDKVTNNLIYSLGFKSVNDRPIITILRFLKFTDDAGIPTERYRQYRNRSMSLKILGQAVREAYAEVFKVFPDADKREQKTLRDFFSTESKLGERAVVSMVETFKALCAISNFDGSAPVFAQEPHSGQFHEGTTQQPQEIGNEDAHRMDVQLGKGRKARLFLPQDLTKKEVDVLKALLDAITK